MRHHQKTLKTILFLFLLYFNFFPHLDILGGSQFILRNLMGVIHWLIHLIHLIHLINLIDTFDWYFIDIGCTDLYVKLHEAFISVVHSFCKEHLTRHAQTCRITVMRGFIRCMFPYVFPNSSLNAADYFSINTSLISRLKLSSYLLIIFQFQIGWFSTKLIGHQYRKDDYDKNLSVCLPFFMCTEALPSCLLR